MFSFTFFGYGALLLQLEKHLLFNPGIVDGRALVDVIRVQPAYVLISQAAREQIGNAGEFAHKTGSLVVGTSQVYAVMRKAGVPSYSLEDLKDGNTMKLGENIQLTGYLLKHGGFLAPRSLAFYIKSTQGCIAYMGNSKEVGPFIDTQPDLLCVPVGGKPYNTLSPEEAVVVTQAICPRYAIPIWGVEKQRAEYIRLLKTTESAFTPVDLLAGGTFTLL